MMSRPSINIFIFVVVLLLLVTSVLSQPIANQTLKEELHYKLRRIRAHLKKINKPGVKTIKSPDGDLIDCVLSHLQPAFDHPELKGQKPLDALPERPKGYTNDQDTSVVETTFQLWADSGEECPERTIPIRRTTEQDLLRASSISRFGRKAVRRDSLGNGHEHAIVYVNGTDQYYGAKARINVWAPIVSEQSEFSLAQVWVTAGSYDNEDLNTIEAGWQVSPQLYGDKYPRLFTYWTRDAYHETGCYNLLCSGFIQTSKKIVLGAAIYPRSSYKNKQYDFDLMVWKDPNNGNWWLEYGSGILVGYWPAFLFTQLSNHAEGLQFGGEIVNSGSMGYHTATQMGSGHFAEEGFGKAAYFKNLQVIHSDNKLVSIPISNIHQLIDNSNCYDVRVRTNIVSGRNAIIHKAWGTYFYYGGPGRNVRCP